MHETSKILATCAEKVRDDDTGQVKNKRHGKTFISTPERIAAYEKLWDALPP